MLCFTKSNQRVHYSHKVQHDYSCLEEVIQYTFSSK